MAPDELPERALPDWACMDEDEERLRPGGYDEWFREVADPDEVAERDRRIAQARLDMSDAFDAGDSVRYEAADVRQEQAFYAMPTVVEDYFGGRLDGRNLYVNKTDDEADGW